MSIEQFKLILYDTYRMDAWMPPLWRKENNNFKKASYAQWGLDELERVIQQSLYPRTEASVEEFYQLVRAFISRMNRYARVNPDTKLIFSSAAKMAMNVLDLLNAMR